MAREPDRNPGRNTSNRMWIGLAVVVVIAIILVAIFLGSLHTQGTHPTHQGPYKTQP